MSHRGYLERRREKLERKLEEERERRCPPRRRRRTDNDHDAVKARAVSILSQRASKARGVETTVADDLKRRTLVPGIPLESEIQRFRRAARSALGRGRR